MCSFVTLVFLYLEKIVLARCCFIANGDWYLSVEHIAETPEQTLFL